MSSFISALIFVRVSGNIIESAQIHDFSTDHPSYQTPDVHFSVNVQNTGNVHIRPSGMIQIYNAFGKERGEIPINGTGTLGYVFLSSSREFDVEWQGQPSLLDIGPYTAVLSLGMVKMEQKASPGRSDSGYLPIDQLLEVGFGILIAAMACMYLLKACREEHACARIAKIRACLPKEEKKRHSLSRHDDGTLDLRNPHDR